ncbi:MAG: tRNA dimethylallyltransferase [Bacteroidales bacterium]|nr:tRNA dimethylallyltransferase [Bacteroidales bacterium]
MICVLGPTASGKTGYAVRLARTLAKDFGLVCEIISADSRQVYRGMDIGTGKDLAEYGDIPYYIIDVTNPGDGYNVYRFCEDFAAAFEAIRAKGRFPILCGGTGLYINAVCSGYDFRSKKPLSASPVIADADRQSLAAATYFIGTLVSREERNARIDARLRARLDEGMVAEVKGLLDAGVPAETLLGYGLEYKFVTLYLQGKLSEEELFTQLSTAIHQFAKRQMTWFRGMERSGIQIHWTRIGKNI